MTVHLVEGIEFLLVARDHVVESFIVGDLVFIVGLTVVSLLDQVLKSLPTFGISGLVVEHACFDDGVVEFGFVGSAG